MNDFFPLRQKNLAHDDDTSLRDRMIERMADALETVALDCLSILDLDVDLIVDNGDGRSGGIKIRVYVALAGHEDQTVYHEHLTYSEQDVGDFIVAMLDHVTDDHDEWSDYRKAVVQLRDRLNKLIADLDTKEPEL